MENTDVFVSILLLCLYLVPVVWVLNSTLVQGKHKNYWLIATVIFSWIALIFMLLVAPKKPRH